jgi:hypothetical protein
MYHQRRGHSSSTLLTKQQWGGEDNRTIIYQAENRELDQAQNLGIHQSTRIQVKNESQRYE